MSCGGCKQSIDRDAARAYAVALLVYQSFWGLDETPRRLEESADAEGWLPDRNGVVRWWGIRWYGIPKPVRWILKSQAARDRLLYPGARLTGGLPGCGCVVVLKDTYTGVRGWLAGKRIGITMS